MKTLQIFYHAQLRESRGLDRETVTSDAASARDLYHELEKTFALSLPIDAMKVAVNDELVDWDHVVQDNDRVALLPPVAGG